MMQLGRSWVLYGLTCGADVVGEFVRSYPGIDRLDCGGHCVRVTALEEAMLEDNTVNKC